MTIALSKTELFIYEGNETISDQLFIEIDGQIEPNVSVKLTLTKGIAIITHACMFITFTS